MEQDEQPHRPPQAGNAAAEASPEVEQQRDESEPLSSSQQQRQPALQPPPAETQRAEQQAASSPTIDFFSPDFDAYAALMSPGLQPPKPKVKPLDTVAQCRRILPQEVDGSTAGAPKPAERSAHSVAAQERARQSSREAAARTLRLQAREPILQKMAFAVSEQGPFGVLRRCYQNKQRVKVVTRHHKGVRGTCIGFLMAFDKYMNMVLRDVDEEYTVLIRVVRQCGQKTRDAEDEQSTTGLKTRVCRKQEHRKRHIVQLLIRGDAVVFVGQVD